MGRFNSSDEQFDMQIFHFKKPSPGIVYSVGQAEQYGYYKMLNYMSSPYDSRA